MQVLHRNLEEAAFEEDFISFRFIATAEQVRDLPRNQSFLIVKCWRNRPDAEEIIEAMKERSWEATTIAALILK